MGFRDHHEIKIRIFGEPLSAKNVPCNGYVGNGIFVIIDAVTGGKKHRQDAQ